MDTNELVATVCPIFNEVGWTHYFHPDTAARAEELGIDGFRFYFIGRGGVLGDVEAPVVASAFGYFAPGVVASMWDSAREVVAPRDAARAFLACAAGVGRDRLADVEGLDAFCAAAEQVVAAADPAAMALFAGLAAEPLPDDLPARAYCLVNVLRELRGGFHLVAVVASGLSPRVAHLIARPDMDAAFGWADQPEVTDAERSQLAEAEAVTDRLCAGVYGVLDAAGSEALAAGAAAIGAALRP